MQALLKGRPPRYRDMEGNRIKVQVLLYRTAGTELVRNYSTFEPFVEDKFSSICWISIPSQRQILNFDPDLFI